MRALAEFIMRGRLQAGTIAVIGNVVPLLTPLAVALVVLRKGTFEGAVVLLFGVLPTLIALMMGNNDAFLLWFILGSLLTVYLPAWVLRSTISLPITVLSVVASSAILALLVTLSIPDTALDTAKAMADAMLVPPDGQAAEAGVVESAALPSLTSGSLSGGLASVMAINSLLGLMVARWLQGALYNPGGFGKEFRAYRLQVPLAVACGLVSILLSIQGAHYWWWSVVWSLPLIVVSASVMHSLVKAKNLGTGWLVLFYIMTLIATQFVVLLGLLDSFVNFRRRFVKADDE